MPAISAQLASRYRARHGAITFQTRGHIHLRWSACLSLQFRPYLLEDGADCRAVQELLGQKDMRTVRVNLHVMNKPGLAVRSPADISSKETREGQPRRPLRATPCSLYVCGGSLKYNVPNGLI